ncbi:MAG: hypothetical protein AAF081_17085 [Actinomycetota bacterium]
MIREFIDEVLSGDRVVFSFVSVWIVAGGVWIVLDWLGNPNRGRFVPKGDRYHGTRPERREARRRQRAEDDAAVRATLRDAYGASSLRVTWTKSREAVAIDADEQLVRPDPRRPIVSQREPARLGTFSEFGVEPLLGTFDPDTPFVVEPAMPRGRWRVGADPLMLSRAGKPPTAATLRSRVWKNHAGDPMWGPTNQDRLRAGKPPRRHNPLTGKVETGVVDLSTARPGWKGTLVDPFAPLLETLDAGEST